MGHVFRFPFNFACVIHYHFLEGPRSPHPNPVYNPYSPQPLLSCLLSLGSLRELVFATATVPTIQYTIPYYTFIQHDKGNHFPVSLEFFVNL